jgi:hypothetical protein
MLPHVLMWPWHVRARGALHFYTLPFMNRSHFNVNAPSHSRITSSRLLRHLLYKWYLTSDPIPKRVILLILLCFSWTHSYEATYAAPGIFISPFQIFRWSECASARCSICGHLPVSYLTKNVLLNLNVGSGFIFLLRIWDLGSSYLFTKEKFHINFSIENWHRNWAP